MAMQARRESEQLAQAAHVQAHPVAAAEREQQAEEATVQFREGPARQGTLQRGRSVSPAR